MEQVSNSEQEAYGTANWACQGLGFGDTKYEVRRVQVTSPVCKTLGSGGVWRVLGQGMRGVLQIPKPYHRKA